MAGAGCPWTDFGSGDASFTSCNTWLESKGVSRRWRDLEAAHQLRDLGLCAKLLAKLG
jgi:hypothetical protein